MGKFRNGLHDAKEIIKIMLTDMKQEFNAQDKKFPKIMFFGAGVLVVLFVYVMMQQYGIKLMPFG